MIMQDYHGVKIGWKSDYVICERSLMVLFNCWKFMDQSLISPSGQESLFEKVERNIFLNISILILILTFKSIIMRETAVNSLKTPFKHFHPTHNLVGDLTKSLKRRDYPFHAQLTWRKISVHSMQHCTLNFAVMRMDSHKIGYMTALLVIAIASKVFVNTEPGIYFSLEGQVVPLAL